jgi:hypothetical protein
MKKGLFIVFIVLVILIVGYVFYSNNSNMFNNNLIANNQANKVLSYVTLDINPSVEFAVDENDVVNDVVTLNEDADIAYSDLNLVGQNVEDATEQVVDTAVELGYITEISDTNSVNVTSYTEDEAKRIDLNKKIVDRLNAHFETRKIYTLVMENGLDDVLKSKADSYGIPYGKMLLVARAMNLDSTLVESDLVKLTIKEIQSKIKTEAVARREQVKNAFKAGKQEFKDVKTQRIAAARIKLAQDKEALLKSVQNPSTLTTEEKQNLIEQRKNQIKEEIKSVKEDLTSSGSIIKENIKRNIKNKYLLKNK